MQEYLIIILFVLVLYFPTLKCLVIVDDVRWYGAIKQGHWAWKNKPTWRNIGNWLVNRLYSGGTFGIQWNQKITRWSITSVQIDHAFSMALTALIGVLMYWDFHSFWAVLLWASSSITTHIAVWLNGRRYAINTILVLLMVACINAGGYWPILALPLYAITPFFHMTAICAPVLYWPSIPIIAVMGFVYWNRISSQMRTKENAIVESTRKEYTWRRLIPITKSYGHYFFKMLFPMMTRTNYNCLYRWGVDAKGDKDAYAFNMDFYKGIFAIGMSAVSFCVCPAPYRKYVAFMALSTAQWCNIRNLTQIVADRYVVLANVFFQVILAFFLPWWACLGIIVANVCFTAMSFRMYENIQGMFDYHFYHWPQYMIVNREYIALCIKQGNYIKAYTLVKECLKFNPTEWDLLLAAALCAKHANDRKLAREYIDLMENNLYYGQEEIQKKWMAEFRRGM